MLSTTKLDLSWHLFVCLIQAIIGEPQIENVSLFSFLDMLIVLRAQMWTTSLLLSKWEIFSFWHYFVDFGALLSIEPGLGMDLGSISSIVKTKSNNNSDAFILRQKWNFHVHYIFCKQERIMGIKIDRALGYKLK